jgi:hypothetical protein
MQRGINVFEALAASEVFHLVENNQVDAVVILPDVIVSGVEEVKKRFITLHLDGKASPADVVWELSALTNRSCTDKIQ